MKIRSKESITLTAREIIDLCEFAGFSVNTFDATDELETEYTIEACPKTGILTEDGKESFHSKYIAYITDEPNEGAYNLGEYTVSVRKSETNT